MLEPQECEDIAEILFNNYNLEGTKMSAGEFATFFSDYFETNVDSTEIFQDCDVDQNQKLSKDEFVSCQCFGDDAEE